MLQQFYTVLMVPNLQGERWLSGIAGAQMDWVPSEQTLLGQVGTISQVYNGQELLMGSSFGGLSAWKFVAEHCPPTLKGVVLNDVLPRMDRFPTHRAIVFGVLNKLPNRMSQLVYDVYRRRSGQRSVDVVTVLQRLASIHTEFPQPRFPLPTLVLSSNPQFHRVWLDLAKVHPQVSAQEKQDLSLQIKKWADGL